MNILLYLKLTISLVFLSIILNLFSFYTSAKGLGNIYPFFSWKLFSQPLVTSNTTYDFRVYSRKANQKMFSRNAIHPTKDFTDDEYMYTLDYLINKTLLDSNHVTTAKKDLFLFLKHIIPVAKEFKIIREKYNPKTLIENPLNYDTTTVITF